MIKNRNKKPIKKLTSALLLVTCCTLSLAEPVLKVDPASGAVNNASGQIPTSAETVAPDFAPSRSLFGTSAQKSFLTATQAFQFSAVQSGNQLTIQAKIAPKHYLYQQKFSVIGGTGVTVGKINFDQNPEFENDPEFGRVPVFHQDLSLIVPVQGEGTVTLNWQGCAKAGVCYPPEQFKTQVIANPIKANRPTQNPSETASKTQVKPDLTKPVIPEKPAVKITALGEKPPLVVTPLPGVQSENQPESAASIVANPESNKPVQAISVPVSQSMVSDPFGLADHPWLALGLLFLAGLGLAFTPCVLPMLPIVANLVATQHRRSARHGFLLAAAYAIGVACSYALLGALIALFGHQLNLIAWSQHPVVLIGFAAIFILLALHTFELFELRLPAVIRGKVEKVGRYGQADKWSGSIFGCWVAGFFSALIVSPCLSAPLAGVLLSVSTVGNPWLGAAALFCLGLGLGVPLMILGATEGKFLPKAGNWLNWVRRGFGLLLVGVALILLNRVFVTSWMLLAWATLTLFFTLWLWYWAGRGGLLAKALALLAGIWAILLVVGASLGATDPMRPLAPLQKNSAAMISQQVPVIYTLAQLEQAKQQHSRLLVELTADWCIACKIVERELFINQPAPELQSWTRIKLDITQTTDASRAVLQQLNLFGPPAILLYQHGQPVEQVLGEPTREQFSLILQKHP